MTTKRPWWPLVAIVLAGAAIGSWAWAVREVRGLERAVLSRPAPVPAPTVDLDPLYADVDACHRRLDTIDRVIRVVVHRVGDEPPRLLDEQMRYRGQDWWPYVPGTAEEMKD